MATGTDTWMELKPVVTVNTAQPAARLSLSSGCSARVSLRSTLSGWRTRKNDE